MFQVISSIKFAGRIDQNKRSWSCFTTSRPTVTTKRHWQKYSEARLLSSTMSLLRYYSFTPSGRYIQIPKVSRRIILVFMQHHAYMIYHLSVLLCVRFVRMGCRPVPTATTGSVAHGEAAFSRWFWRCFAGFALPPGSKFSSSLHSAVVIVSLRLRAETLVFHSITIVPDVEL